MLTECGKSCLVRRMKETKDAKEMPRTRCLVRSSLRVLTVTRWPVFFVVRRRGENRGRTRQESTARGAGFTALACYTFQYDASYAQQQSKHIHENFL